MTEGHYRVSDYRAAGSVGYLLRRLYTTMLARMESAFVGHDLTLMQWIVLMYLRDGLARTASDFAREFRHDSGALTRLIDQLEDRGLLARRRSEQDRRVVSLSLTTKGSRTIDSLLPLVVGQMNEALAPLSREEFEQFRSTLARLVDHLQGSEPPTAAPRSLRDPAMRRVASKAPTRRGRS